MDVGICSGLQHKGEWSVVLLLAISDRLHDRTAQMAIDHHIVVQGAVGFNIADLYIESFCHFAERANLMLHQLYYFCGRQVHRAAAKANRVWIAGVGTDSDIVLFG